MKLKLIELTCFLVTRMLCFFIAWAINFVFRGRNWGNPWPPITTQSRGWIQGPTEIAALFIFVE